MHTSFCVQDLELRGWTLARSITHKGNRISVRRHVLIPKHSPLFLHDERHDRAANRTFPSTRVGTLIVATIYLQLIQNRYMFRSFTVLQCSHQHCLQPVVSDVEVVGYL